MKQQIYVCLCQAWKRLIIFILVANLVIWCVLVYILSQIQIIYCVRVEEIKAQNQQLLQRRIFWCVCGHRILHLQRDSCPEMGYCQHVNSTKMHNNALHLRMTSLWVKFRITIPRHSYISSHLL